MGEVIQHRAPYKPLLDPRVLSLIRNTVAKNCSDAQFDEFMYIARQKNLDPMMRQIHCIIINKGKKDDKGNSTEQMIPVTGIGGYRAIAARKGNYLPDDQPAKIIRRKTAINPDTNPTGIVSATVSVKCYMHDEWHRISGRANWLEYAPLKDEWAYDPELGKDVPTGKRYLPRNNRWFLSPEMMLEKVAEAQALRRGWPDAYSQIFEEAEFDRYKILELSPSEFARLGEQMEREQKIGGPGIIIDFLEDGPLESVPAGRLADRVLAFIETFKESPLMLEEFQNRNRVSLNQFWTHNKADALAIRKKFASLEKKAVKPVSA